MSQLRTNPLRTMLTLLGVVFGVGSVVAMVSIGEGAQRDILATIEAMGAKSVHVSVRETPDTEIGKTINDSVGLSRHDVSVLEREIPGAQAVGWRASHSLAVTDTAVPTGEIALYGVNEELFRVHNLNVARGRALHAIDARSGHRVVVIGDALARRLFSGEEALGEVVRLDYSYFEVVGVLAPMGGAPAEVVEGEGGEGAEGLLGGGGGTSGAFDASEYDMSALVPGEVMFTELAPPRIYHELDMISVEVGSTAQTMGAKAALEGVLARTHGGVRDFSIVAPEEILRQRQATQSILNAVLISIAAISLLVGGIGVMNIMLANIMERVTEIGLRRAVGATKRDIRNQFLGEAVWTCSLGGALGVALGYGASLLVGELAGLPIAFAWGSTALSFGLSLLVGVTFGLMPAMRAANVDPIDALRGE